MKLYDGKNLVEIDMRMWDKSRANYTPDFSNDFFGAAPIPYDAEREAYIVEDVEYCIDQANDWTTYRGDYYYDEPDEDFERSIFIDVLQ